MIQLPVGLNFDADELLRCAKRYGSEFSIALIDERRALARAFERVLNETRTRFERITRRCGLADVVELTELSCLFFALFTLAWSRRKTPAEEQLYWEILRRFGT
jgi:hypothetical protein